MNTEKIKLPFIILLAAGIFIRLAVLLFMPQYPAKGVLPGYNDEPLHLNYIKYMAAGGGIPVYANTGIDSIDHPRGEFGQTPLYYAFTMPAYRLMESVSTGKGIFAVRLLSALFGIIAALFAFKLTLIWTGRERPALAVMAAMMLAPNAVVFTSIVTNDALLICISTMALYSIILCRMGNKGTVRQMLTGMYLAAAVWSKLSGLFLFPLIWFAADPDDSVREQWISRGKVAAVAIALLMPMLTWNMLNYGHFYAGATYSSQAQYLPEQAVGVVGGAVYHPLMALKIWLRTAAQPYLELWGSVPEKLISSVWLVFWSGLLMTGLIRLLRNPDKGMLFLIAIASLMTGFFILNITQFQVEFRLLGPVFAALAILTAFGAERFRIPLSVQSILWATPVVLSFVL